MVLQGSEGAEPLPPAPPAPPASEDEEEAAPKEELWNAYTTVKGLSVAVGGLKEGKLYKFRVAAKNLMGLSLFTETKETVEAKEQKGESEGRKGEERERGGKRSLRRESLFTETGEAKEQTSESEGEEGEEGLRGEEEVMMRPWNFQ